MTRRDRGAISYAGATVPSTPTRGPADGSELPGGCSRALSEEGVPVPSWSPWTSWAAADHTRIVEIAHAAVRRCSGPAESLSPPRARLPAGGGDAAIFSASRQGRGHSARDVPHRRRAAAAKVRPPPRRGPPCTASTATSGSATASRPAGRDGAAGAPARRDDRPPPCARATPDRRGRARVEVFQRDGDGQDNCCHRARGRPELAGTDAAALSTALTMTASSRPQGRCLQPFAGIP